MKHLAALLALAVGLLGCPVAKSPRHIARGAVLSVAYGVQVADKLCVVKAREIAGVVDGEDPEEDAPAPNSVKNMPVVSKSTEYTKALALRNELGWKVDQGKISKGIAFLEKCESGYDGARAGLLAAANAVDAWGDIEKSGQVACGVSEAVTGLNYMVDVLEAAGVKMPPAVQDAQVAATFVGGLVEMKACKVKP